MQTDMLVSGFPGRVYLSAASPMLVAPCTCVVDIDKLVVLFNDLTRIFAKYVKTIFMIRRNRLYR